MQHLLLNRMRYLLLSFFNSKVKRAVEKLLSACLNLKRRKLMKVEILQKTFLGSGNLWKGDIIELDEKQAKSLISNNLAKEFKAKKKTAAKAKKKKLTNRAVKSVAVPDVDFGEN